MSNETPLRGRPTLRTRARRRIGGIVCRRCLEPCGDTIPEVTR